MCVCEKYTEHTHIKRSEWSVGETMRRHLQQLMKVQSSLLTLLKSCALGSGEGFSSGRFVVLDSFTTGLLMSMCQAETSVWN